MAIIESHEPSGGCTLHVDHFGLSIGAVSVGLPRSCTADDVYRRYLDLRRLCEGGGWRMIDTPPEDLAALAAATAYDCEYIARRLVLLQRS